MAQAQEPFTEYHVLQNQENYFDSATKNIEFIRKTFYKLRDDHTLRKTKETKVLLHDLCQVSEKLKIDIELFMHSPQAWQDRWGNREIVTQRECIEQFVQILKDHDFEASYRKQMTMPTDRPHDLKEYFHQSGTILRQTNEWAVNTLKSLLRLIKPLTEEANDRVHQYTDHLGISSRYENYRKSCNFERGNKGPDSALTTEFRPSVAPRWHLSRNYLRAQRLGTDQIDKCPKPELYGDWPNGEVEAAGIIPRHPGLSEYQYRYCEPFRYIDPPKSLAPMSTYRYKGDTPQDVRGRGNFERSQKNHVGSKGYTINPSPKLGSLYGDRELIPPPAWKFPKSEVQQSYTPPHCKLPHRSFWESAAPYL